MRFAGTSAVTAAIDGLVAANVEDRVALRRALFAVLGLVKDPAAIPWLERHLAAGRHELLVHEWLVRWEETYPEIGESRWLEQKDRWARFLVDAFRSDPHPEHAANWLHVLSGFSQQVVIELFEERRREARDPLERIVVEVVLEEHGREIQAQVLADALQQLARSGESADPVFYYAARSRHAEFVPFLINALTSYGSKDRIFDPQGALEEIAYRRDIQGAKQWREWFAAHGHETRESWRRAQVSALKQQLDSDEAAALAAFTRLVYLWDEIAFLDFIEAELLPRPAFHTTLAGWINLTYRPAYRSQLEPIARQITRNPDALDPHARLLLTERGFLPPPREPTWADHVAKVNSRL